ncbi:MAG: histidinol-phosphate transaminase [Hyphomicrobiales bacterium]|nr:histidinol-phosphate transaminase [Hyphomicrobiales bacterium]
MSIPIQPKEGIFEISRYKGGKGASTNKGIKLSSNESAIGPSQMAIKAFIEASSSLSIYPDGNSTLLKENISATYGLDIKKIFCGAGSDEILNLIANAYLLPGDEVVYSEHAFLLYRIITLANNAKPIVAPEIGLKANVDNIINSITSRTKIVFIANPNNPTGSYLNKDELYDLRKRMPDKILLVVDGAYAEYVQEVDYCDGLDLVSEKSNTIMTRTFSKVYGLASLRIGWAYCPTFIIETLNKIRGPFNLSTASIYAGSAALKDTDHVQKSIALNTEEKEYLNEEYTSMGVNVIKGVANFLLLDFRNVDHTNYIGEQEISDNLNDYLYKNNIFLRDVSDYGLTGHLRLSIGNKEQNRIVLKKIQEYLSGDSRDD